MATHATPTSTAAYCLVAERLLAAGAVVEGCAALESLVRRLHDAGDAVDELRVRVRVADVLLTRSVAADAPRRVLEEGREGLRHPAVPAAVRAAYHRLLGIAYRRRQLFDRALGEFAAARKHAATADERDAIAVDTARVHYARCVDTGFGDPAAIAALAECSADAAGAAAARGSVTDATAPLVVCRALALVFQHRWAAALSLIHAVTAVPGAPLAEDFAVVAAFVEYAAGVAPTSSAAAAHSLGEKRPRDDQSEATAAAGARWMSPGARRACTLLIQLLGHTAACRGSDAAAVFNTLSDVVECELKHVTAAGVNVTPQLNADLRLLVGVKFVGYHEMALVDITRLELHAAAVKLDALVGYVQLFVRHTPHFRPYLHAAISALALALGRTDAALAHAEAVAGCTGADCADLARLLRATALYAARDDPNHHAAFLALVDESAPAPGAPPTSPTGPSAAGQLRRAGSRSDDAGAPNDDGGSGGALSARHAALWDLLVGARHISGHDYPAAVARLKRAADSARAGRGSNSPLVATALRFLADAHSFAGSAALSEASATMATQIAVQAGDALGLTRCLVWALSRMPVVTAADVERQRLMNATVDGKLQLYAAAVDAAAGEQTDAVLGFLPDVSADYRRWMGRVGGGNGNGQSRTSQRASA